MKSKLIIHRLCKILFSVCVAFSAFGTCQAGDTVTIVTYNYKYENVTYKINDDGATLTVILPDDEVEIGRNDIRFIFDKNNNDILKSIFDETTAPIEINDRKEHSTVDNLSIIDSKEGETFKHKPPIVKLPWNMAIRFGSGLCIPVGDYFEGIKAGVGYEGNLFFGNDKDMIFRLSIASATCPTGNEYKWYSTNPDIVILDQKTELKIARYQVGIEGFEYFNKNEPNSNMYHGYFGCGIIKQKLETHVTARNDSTGEIGELYGKVSESKFELTGGVGCLIGIGKKAAMDFSVEYDMIFLGKNNGRAYIFGVKAGLFIPLKISSKAK